MQRDFLLFIILFVLVFGFGCSGGGANTESTNTEVPAADSIDANAALAEGKRLLDENQTEAAIAAFEKAVELNPDLAEAHFQLGIAYDLLDMQKEQSGEFTETKIDEKKKTRSEKAFEKAVTAYKKWLAKNPKDDVAHFNLGRTFSKLNKDEEAVDSFEQAVKLKPDDTEYQTELGAAQINLARYHEAIKSLKKAIELDETNDRAIMMLEDAEAGRQRVTYKSKPDESNANKALKSNSKLSNSNTATNANGAAKTPPANTTPAKAPTPRPASTPREQPRGRMPNPETRPRKIN
jgi:tetratricopeptide (TPR) repeat protein